MTARVGHWAGVGGWRASPTPNMLYSQTIGVAPGSNSMWRIFVGVKHRYSDASTSEMYASHSASVATHGGWRMRWDGAFVFEADDAGGTHSIASLSSIAMPLGRSFVHLGVVNDSFVFSRVGVSEASAGKGAGYRANVNNDPLVFGAATAAGGFNAFSFAHIAVLGSDLVAPDAAGRLALVRAVEANLAQGRALDAGLPFAPQWYWDMGDYVPGQDLADRIAGEVMLYQNPVQRFGLGGRA